MMITAKRFALFVSSVGLFTMLAGCSAIGDKVPSLGSIFSEKNESASAEEIYYTRSPDLPLYQSPGGVIIRRLPQYTKLTRTKQEKGYAHVRISSTGVTGWVKNDQLIWRLPKDTATGTTKPAAAQPAAEPVQEPVQEPVVETPAPQTAPVVEAPAAPTPSPAPAATVPATAPATEPSKPSVAPSIFNPY
jgi:hypothetical protein